MYLLCVHVQNQFDLTCIVYDVFFTVVKENESHSKRSEEEVDCAEQDVGCWSQVWSARYM